MAEKGEPGYAARWIAPKMLCKNPANDVFVDLNAKGEGSLLSDPPAAEPIVPRTKRLNTLIRAFQNARSHMAVVVDECGDFEGIVTLEDVLEEICRRHQGRGRRADRAVRQPDGSLHVAGTTELRRICRAFGNHSRARRP